MLDQNAKRQIAQDILVAATEVSDFDVLVRLLNFLRQPAGWGQDLAFELLLLALGEAVRSDRGGVQSSGRK